MFWLELPIPESTRTADLPACPTFVTGCQSRALPVQRPDSPCASSNCLSGTPPTFPSNYLTLPPHPPPLALLSAGDFFFSSVKTVQDKGRRCTGVRAHSWPSEATAGIQKSDFAIFLQEWPPAQTHTHTHCSPLGEGIVAGKPFAAHHVVMETARTRTLVQESFCLSCLKSGINNVLLESAVTAWSYWSPCNTDLFIPQTHLFSVRLICKCSL